MKFLLAKDVHKSKGFKKIKCDNKVKTGLKKKKKVIKILCRSKTDLEKKKKSREKKQGEKKKKILKSI